MRGERTCKMRKELMKIHKDMITSMKNKTKPLYKRYLPRRIEQKMSKKRILKDGPLRETLAILYKNPLGYSVLGDDIRK
jgi:hypothetical protein